MGMIKLPKASVDFFKENIDEIFSSGNLAEGAWSARCEEFIKSYTSSKSATVCNSNGAGLHAVLAILRTRFGKKDIFIQENTMYGVKTIAETSGLQLVGLVDCDLHNILMPTARDVESFVSMLKRPSETVFMLTHIGGWVNPQMNEIMEICDDAGVVVVEDCAHSIGATLGGKHSGTFGIAGVYSFYATKSIPVGEGGCVITDDDALGSLIQKFSIYDRFDQVEPIGLNIRMSEINALLCFGVLEHTDAIINSKQEIASIYVDACDEMGLQYVQPVNSNLYKFIVYSEDHKIYRHFPGFKNKTSPVYDYDLGGRDTPISRGHLCLPIWYNLEKANIQNTVAELRSTFS